MADLIDFDRKFMEYVAPMIRGMGELPDGALEERMNEAAKAWSAAAADWLGGLSPDEYFAKMQPEDLAEQLRAYAQGGMQVPEPLYRRIAQTPECADALARMARDADLRCEARASALRLLCDRNARGLPELCADMLPEGGDLAEIAADWLGRAGKDAVEPLFDRYDAADAQARAVILDVLSRYPGDARVTELIAERLRNDHERRALYAALAERLGDASLIGVLTQLAGLSELSYFDYMEIANAIEALGGEIGEARAFYGDPDYETLWRQDA